MTRRNAFSNLSALVLMVVIVAISLGVGACGASGKPGAAPGCRVGDTVTPPAAGKQLPACTDAEPRGSAYNYPCRQGAQDFYLIYLADAVLYGRPGDTWHRASADAGFARLRAALHC